MRALRAVAVCAVLALAACDCSKPPAVADGGSCQAGLACATNSGAPCRSGVTACAGDVASCVDGHSAAAGTSCGADTVCDATGACVACAQGLACDTNSTACRQGVLDCAHGPTCSDGPARDAGTSCGANLVCNPSGACVACASGSACATNPGAPCLSGTVACGGGTPACVDENRLDAGTSCGANLVCNPSGACVACAAGSACATNPGAPCLSGTVACGGGTPACVDGNPLDAGTSCGSNLVCSASGACVACASGSACATNPGAPCFSGTVACGSGAPACVDAAPAAPGLACGASQVCTGDGGCVACAADAGCQPGGNACLLGAVTCASGGPLCLSLGPAGDGTLCTGGSCLKGSCQPSAVVSTAVNLSQASVLSGRTCADAPSYAVTGLTATTATLATAPGACLVAGDEVLLVNEQGAPGATANVGAYELLPVAAVAGSTVTFGAAKARRYGASAGSDTGLGTGPGQQRVALIRVPHYGDLTVSASGSLTVDPWNGSTGGVLALRAATLHVDGTVTVTGKGYRDGHYSVDGPCQSSVETEQGESISGFGTQSLQANSGGSGGIGAGAGSFAGDTPINPTAGHSSPGSPGLNGGSRPLGAPGDVYGSPDGGLLTMGSGVSGNLTCNGSGAGPSLVTGATGNYAGGVVYLVASSLIVSSTGRIVADAAPSPRDGAPSAGSIMLRGKVLSLGTNRVTAIGATVIPGSPTTVGTVKIGSPGYVWLFYAASQTGTTSPAPYVEQTPTP